MEMNILSLTIPKHYGDETAGLRSSFIANHKSLETGFWTCSSMCSTDMHPRAESAARQRVTVGHCEDMKLVRPRGH